MNLRAAKPVVLNVSAKKWRRRALVYGGLLAGLWGFYVWQPWEFDFVPRQPPLPNPPVDPDSGRLFLKGARVAVITAHPDDSEFYIGGVLTKLHADGAEMYEIVCTDGDKGYYPFSHPEALGEVRRSEQRNAAAVWGARQVDFLGFPDGRLRVNDETIGAVESRLEQIQPEYVLAFDGDYAPRFSHQDHRRAGDLAQIAARRAPSVKWLLRFSTIAPNYAVDITDEWDAQKALLALHRSQFSGDHLTWIENMVGSNAEADGERIGVGLAESFRCSRLHG